MLPVRGGRGGLVSLVEPGGQNREAEGERQRAGRRGANARRQSVARTAYSVTWAPLRRSQSRPESARGGPRAVVH